MLADAKLYKCFIFILLIGILINKLDQIRFMELYEDGLCCAYLVHIILFIYILFLININRHCKSIRVHGIVRNLHGKSIICHWQCYQHMMQVSIDVVNIARHMATSSMDMLLQTTQGMIKLSPVPGNVSLDMANVLQKW
jgi:hypothetical protein